MSSQKYDRKNARAILSKRERDFLLDYEEGESMTSSKRHLRSSIQRKTRKAFEDLSLIFRKTPEAYVLFFEQDEPISLAKPVEEVTRLFYGLNYRRELEAGNWSRSKVDRNGVRQQTRRYLIKIIDSVLENVKLP